MNYQENLKEFYAPLDSEDAYERQWGYGNPVAADYWRMRDTLVFGAITSHFAERANDIRALEVGAGHGHELAKLLSLKIPGRNLAGIDLLEKRVHRARQNYPSITFYVQDATALSFPDNSFDLVMQFTCCFHAPTRDMHLAMCSEMARVLRPGGIILWWDVAPPSWRTICIRRFSLLFGGLASWRQIPGNLRQTFREILLPSARRIMLQRADLGWMLSVDAHELPQLFRGLRVHARRAGADFVIWEMLWRRCPPLARAVWRSGFCSRHCFAVIQKL